MGKRAEQTKKRRKLVSGPKRDGSVSQPSALPDRTAQDDAHPVLLFAEDIETAVLVLDTLAEDVGELSQKRYKDLKRSVHALHRVMADGTTLGSSLASRISAALQEFRFTDARVLLFEMYARRIPPKLGSLQRWVRECDATISLDGVTRDADAMKCLDLILRIANPASIACSSRTPSARAFDSVVLRRPAWRARSKGDTEISIWDKMQNATLFDVPPPTPYPHFKAVHHTPGHLRKPPNLYSSTVYASSPGAIQLTPPSKRPRPSRVDVPGLPGAFMVLDVFTPEECVQIVQAAVAIGFERDEAAGGSALQKTSNFVWLADHLFLDHFFSQIRPFVPSAAPKTSDGNGGGRVRGINGRFRVYQYTENQVYRPHIDGAWPAAGLDKATGEYLHDSSPPSDPLWSRYTLLVYLNSDIPDGTGCTTFFTPSSEMGCLDATSVQPIQGAVLCFPHGDTEGSLLHEGSAVGADGGKLVIRTDLLYEAKGFGQYKPPASLAPQNGGAGQEGVGG